MKTKEIIDRINSLKLVQNDWYEEQSFGTDIDSAIDKCSWKSIIDTSSHRWYDTGVQVFENTDAEFFGVQFVIQLKSESMCTGDCYHVISAFPVEEKIITSYQRITHV